jgi:hypothetical membrane protein
MEITELVRRMGMWALLCGILCIVFYVLHDIIGAMNYPGYDPMRQAVSDLTAVDAPSFAVASGYVAVYGIFSCICCVLLCIMAREENKYIRTGIYLFTAMQAVSSIGYSLFPLTSSGYDGSMQSFVHVYVLTVLVVILSIASLVSIAIGGFKGGRKPFGVLALIALFCMFFGAAGSAALPVEVFGLVERFSTYSAVVFVGVLGAYGYFCIAGAGIPGGLDKKISYRCRRCRSFHLYVQRGA